MPRLTAEELRAVERCWLAIDANEQSADPDRMGLLIGWLDQQAELLEIKCRATKSF